MTADPQAPAEAAPERLWSGFDLLWLALLYVLLAIVLGAPIGWLAPDPVTEVQLIILASVLALALPAALLLARRPDRRVAVGLVPAPLGEAGRAALYLLAVLPVAGLINLVVATLLDAEEHPQSDMLLDQMALGPLAVTVVLTVVVVPIVEELIFRGILLSALLERGPRDPARRRWAAIIASSLIFGLIHIDPQLIGGTAVLGFAAAVLRMKSGSLWPAILLHQLNNALASVILASGIA